MNLWPNLRPVSQNTESFTCNRIYPSTDIKDSWHEWIALDRIYFEGFLLNVLNHES